jgi:hypothetical protein
VFGFDVPNHWQETPIVAAKFAVALGIGLLLIRRAQQLQKVDEAREEAAIFRRAA